MSTNKETMKFERKERYMNSKEDEKLLTKVNTTKKETLIRPHFELHTQSSLLKRKEPKQSSTINLKRLKKSEGSRVCKRRSGVAKQSKSMHMLKTIFMREKDSHEMFGSSPNKLVKIAHNSKDCSQNSFASSKSNSIESISYDFAKWTECLTKSKVKVDSKDKITQIETHLEKSHTSFRDDQTSRYTPRDIQCSATNSSTSTSLQNSTKNTFISIKNHPFVQTQRGTQLNDEFDNSCYELKIHHVLKSQRKSEDRPLDKEHSIKTQVYRRSVLPNVTCRNRGWETLRGEEAAKTAIQGGDVVSVNHLYNSDLGNIGITKQADDSQPILNDSRMSSRRKCAGRKFVSSLPVWKSAEVRKTSNVKSIASLTQKSTASGNNQQRNKHSSIKYDESLENQPKRVLKCRRHSKLLMKENRDPCADRVLEFCEQLVETGRAKDVKQRGVLTGGTLLRRRRSTTKVVCLPSSNLTPVSDRRSDARSQNSRSRSSSKSRSQYWQSRLGTPKNSSKSRQDINDDCIKFVPTYKKKSRPLGVMHALKEIINSSKNNENVRGNVEISENRETSQSIQTVGTQTLPRCEENVIDTQCHVIDTGCNTMPYKFFCKDAEVSCDLIGSISSKTDVDPSAIVDGLVSEDISICTIVEPRSIEYIKTDDESICSDDTEQFSISECEKIGDGTELESCISTATLATTIDTNHVFATETKTAHEDEMSSKSLSDHDGSIGTVVDKYEESIEHLNDDVIGNFANDMPNKSHCTSLSLYDYDASCSDSSEEVTEHLEDDIRHKDAVAPELGVNSIPSDVLTAFQIATEYARNLHKAVLLYNESLMPQESETQCKAASEDHGIQVLGEDRHCVGRSASFVSCRSDDRSKSECDTEYCLIMSSDEDFDMFSALPSSSGQSLLLHQCGLEEENAFFPQSVETSMKLVQKRSDLMLVNVKSFARLLMHRTQEEKALRVLQLEELTENEKPQDGERAKNTLVLFATKFLSIMTHKNLIPVIYCLLCILAFWCLHISFTCNSGQ